MKNKIKEYCYTVFIAMTFLASLIFIVDVELWFSIPFFVLFGIFVPYLLNKVIKRLIHRYTSIELRHEFNLLSNTITSNDNIDTYDFRMAKVPIRDHSGKDIGHQGPISIVDKYMKKQLDSYNDRKILENHKK